MIRWISGINYYPNLILLKTENFDHKISTSVLLSSLFWHSLVGPVILFISYHVMLPINVNYLASSTDRNNFVVFDVSFQGSAKRPGRFETITLYRMQVS